MSATGWTRCGEPELRPESDLNRTSEDLPTLNRYRQRAAGALLFGQKVNCNARMGPRQIGQREHKIPDIFGASNHIASMLVD